LVLETTLTPLSAATTLTACLLARPLCNRSEPCQSLLATLKSLARISDSMGKRK
jgi:hypothetical protein